MQWSVRRAQFLCDIDAPSDRDRPSERAGRVLDGAELVDRIGDKLIFIGVDNEGVELHMAVVPDDRNPERLACIHAIQTYYLTEEGQ